MCFFFSLLPATAWLVIGFFVLFVSTRAEGGLRTFGRILGVWALLIALMFPMMGAYVTVSDACPMEAMMENAQHRHTPGAEASRSMFMPRSS
jgi:hypothetical protein